VVPNTIRDDLIYRDELSELNPKRPDASQDELLRDETRPGDPFIWQTALLAETIWPNQETEQHLRQVRRIQDPLKEYGSPSAGVLVAISLHLSKPVDETNNLRQRCTNLGCSPSAIV
jgi:hypothetical protein